MSPAKEQTSSEARAAELREELAGHDHAYYVLDDPTIGDDEYDALLNELRDLEEANPELRTPDSPTQRVGGKPLDKFEQVEPPRADAFARGTSATRRSCVAGSRGSATS